jgi:hypothetical protein
VVKELNLSPAASQIHGNGFTIRREEHHPRSNGTGGIRTLKHGDLSSAALPVGVPCRRISAPEGIRTPDLLADNEASTPGCSTRAFTERMAQEGFEPSASLVLSESGLPVAYRALIALMPEVGFEPTITRF